MNKCPACGNTQEAAGVCEKCGAQTEAETTVDSSSEATPAGDSGEAAEGAAK